MIYELEPEDFPSFEEIRKAAQEYFEMGHDPGEYQGFMNGCAFMLHHFGYRFFKMKDGEWVKTDSQYIE